MSDTAPLLELSGGTRMPQVALGTWPMNDDEVEQAFRSAVEVGYRHVDTAENYENEAGVGRGVRSCGLPREEVFVTTKFNRKWHSDPAAGLAGNLERLGLDHVDLLLIHWPNPDQNAYLQAWEGMLALREKGLARAIGTSNFKPAHLTRLIEATGVAPEVNQIELHPWADRSAEREFHAQHGIVTEGWSPLGRGEGVITEELVQQIAEAHGRTPGQVLLRWAVQQDCAVAPKSANQLRQRENLSVFDFSLSEEEVQALTSLQPPADFEVKDSDEFGH
ncbi:aldo/keto reductase [Naumannella sp. ID2617S]|uniref:Oxidoreductase n=1 Tax=Enemella dayhoffiae TaxID=2016507 RepID=A0A255GS42_9ACTN|nr:aldo/keto reductase [Enemella dayhoffiae]NNG20636.1 aldo/keto reductase [Naumannella sp. ID2617S]OYO18618.1 oxidoreductase [Enemella dayhoffiae]